MPIRFSGQEATMRHAGVDITQVFHPLAPSESTNTKNALFSNTGPVIMMLTSSVASPASNQNVTFTATVIDPDVLSGTDDLTYVWTNNGTVVRTTSDSTSLTDTYSTSASGETRNIAVTVTDNEGDSDSDSINQVWAQPQLANFTVTWINPAGGIQPNSSTGSFVDVTPTYTMTNNNAFNVNVSMRFERSGGGGMGGFGFVSFDANGAQSTIGVAPPTFSERWRPDSYQPTGNYPETYNATPTTVPFLANVSQTMGGNIRTVLATSDQTLSWIWIISASGFSNLEIAPPNGGYRRTS